MRSWEGNGGERRGWDRGLPGVRNLLLQLRGLEGEQELLDVVLAELVNAARVNGAAQELIHLVLGVQGLLGTAAGDSGGSGPHGGAGCDPPHCPAQECLLVLAGVIDALQRHNGGSQGHQHR